jgi:starvation-inducible DNA-binding protein
MSCQSKLKTLISDNFIVYFKSQVYHLNITGPNFPQYHALLQEVYEYLSTAHDDLNEQCRQMGNMCMTSLKEYAEESNFTLDNKAKTDKAMLDDLTKALDSIHMSAQILYTEAGAEGHGALETFIGDYMTGVSKLHWKVKSCLS